jgi:hypothetical protein
VSSRCLDSDQRQRSQIESRRSQGLQIALAIVVGMGIVTVSERAHASEPAGPPSIMVNFTSPTQEVFAIEVHSGELAYVRNNVTGNEYAFSVSVSQNLIPSMAGLESSKQIRNRPSFDLRIYQVSHSSGELLLKVLASATQVPLNEQFIEPQTGFILSPIKFRPWGMGMAEAVGDGNLWFCCVDCDDYTSCGNRVFACGRTCHNTAPVAALN